MSAVLSMIGATQAMLGPPLGEATLAAYLTTSAVLFVIGLVGFLVRRNMIVMFLCTELMFQAAAIAMIAFGRYPPGRLRAGLRDLHPDRRRGRGGAGAGPRRPALPPEGNAQRRGVVGAPGRLVMFCALADILHAAPLLLAAETPTDATAGPAWAGLILAFPALATLLCGLCMALRLRNKLPPAWITVVCLAASFALTLLLYLDYQGPVTIPLFELDLPAPGASGGGGGFSANFALYVDSLTLLWMLFVTGLGTLIASTRASTWRLTFGPAATAASSRASASSSSP